MDRKLQCLYEGPPNREPPLFGNLHSVKGPNITRGFGVRLGFRVSSSGFRV